MADIIELEIVQGDTGPIWHIGVPNIDVDGNLSGDVTLTNYTCTLKITKQDASDYERGIVSLNTGNTRFLAQLTSEETDAAFMGLGLNRIVFEIKDDQTPPYVSEVQVDVTVKAQRRSV